MTEAETADPRGAEVTTEFGTGSGIEPREEEEEAATDKLASETRERLVSGTEEISRRGEAELQTRRSTLSCPMMMRAWETETGVLTPENRLEEAVPCTEAGLEAEDTNTSAEDPGGHRLASLLAARQMQPPCSAGRKWC